MRKVAVGILFLVLTLPPWGRHNDILAEGANTASDVITAINAYRAQNNLYTYQTNSILMNAAQAHSNYQASIGSVTHTGTGGSRPIDRAYDAGYGEGQIIFITEIIYGGTNTTVNDAVTWWKNSPIHNTQMLATTYVDIGAGVAKDGTWVYYTAVMGYAAGGVAPTLGTGNGNTNGVVFVPVLVSTPNADGSIIHIVQIGQTLIGIATAYDITQAELFALNNLNQSSYIFPGDEIIIQVGMIIVTPTPTSVPTATAEPVVLAGAAGLDTSQKNETTKPVVSLVVPEVENNSSRWVIILSAVGVFFFFLGGLMIPRAKEE